MEVYIEEILVENILINNLIFSSVAYCLKLKTRKIIIFLLSVLVSIFSLVYPFLFSNILKFFFRLTLLFFISFILSFNEEKLLLTSFILFCFTGLYVGFVLLMTNLLDLKKTFIISASIFCSVVLYFILKNILLYLLDWNKKQKYLFDVQLVNGNISKILVKSFLDSGNCLVDNASGKGILVIDLFVAEKLFKDVLLIDILLKDTKKLEKYNARIKKVLSLNGSEQTMLVLDCSACEIKVDNRVLKHSKIPLGISVTKLSNNNEFQALLSKDYLVE